MDRREALDQVTLVAQPLRERIGFLVGGFGIAKCRLQRPRTFLIAEKAEWPTADKLKPVFEKV
jgi:hypothetical protein